MINIEFDTKEIKKTLDNIVSYSHGFTKGIKVAQPNFNKELGIFIEEALKKYIDAKARGNPQSLHHVYEWGMVGNPSGRLFEFTMTYGQKNIFFSASFIPSSSISEGSTEPFVNKAEMMENAITIVVEPESAKVLAFEDDGEMVFTPNSVTIENPGGDYVAGSFENVVKEFFNNYLTIGLLKSSGVFDKLKYAKEYSNRFSEGAKVGSSAGISAGKDYLSIGGITVE